jgi:hypothetical protein
MEKESTWRQERVPNGEGKYLEAGESEVQGLHAGVLLIMQGRGGVMA